MDRSRLFLAISAVLLFPIALSYGLFPRYSMDFLFGLSVFDTNAVHILRAVMGLYLALIVYWLIGARCEEYKRPALQSLVVFMFGLAFGRALSLIVDGMPHWLLVAYLITEIVFGVIGIRMLKKTPFGAETLE